MKPILFEKDATVFTSYGIGLLPDAISCTITEERNGSFELEMVYPISGVNFDEIEEDRIIVAKARENGTNQAFRIYRITSLLSGEVTINARHISYQLNFVPVDSISGSGTAQTMMNSIKGAALEACPFTFESDITGTKAYDFPVPFSFRTGLGGMEGSVLDLFGGEFEWDNWNVKLHSARGSDKGVKIAYGKNLTALERSTDIGSVITGVAAFYAGQDENGNDVIVYSSPKVITNANVSDYAHGRTIVLDISGEFDSVPTQAQVTTYAQAYLAATTLAKASEELYVDFVPLWHTQEFANIYKEHIDLCDTVTVVYERLGVNVKRKVTKTVFNVLVERYESIELGGEVNIADTIAGLTNESSDLARQFAQLSVDVEKIGDLVVESKSGSISVNANTGNNADIDITKSGYMPIAIAAFDVSGAGSASAVTRGVKITSATACNFVVYNLGSSNRTFTISVSILYKKI